MAGLTHGNEIKIEKESGGGGVGPARWVEGWTRPNEEHDGGATQGQREESRAGAMVENGQETLIIIETARAVWHTTSMKINSTSDQIKKGGRIVYNDGRPGHKGVMATVLAVDGKVMTVQFEDRADTSRIAFSDKAWMDFIELAD